MELIVFISVLLASPLIGGIYSFIGEGKKRKLRLGMKGQVTGIGKWYSHSLTSWRKLFLYFWFFFMIPYPLTYLVTITWLPSLVQIITNLIGIGFIISTVFAISISHNLIRLPDHYHATDLGHESIQ